MAEQGYFERDIEGEFRLYQDLYQLPVHHCFAGDTPGPFLNYCRNRRFFVIVFVYSADYRTFVIPSLFPATTYRLDQLFEINAREEVINAWRSLISKPHQPSVMELSTQQSAGTRDAELPPHVGESPELGNESNDGPCKYHLPAGAIKLFSRREGILEAVRRIVSQQFSEIGKIHIGEITPVVCLQNHFFQGPYYHAHDGMGFMCRVKRSLLQNVTTREAERLHIVDADIGSVDKHLIVGGDRQVFEHAKEKIRHRKIDEFDEEISASRSVTIRMRLHNMVVKPAFSLFGRGAAKNVLKREIKEVADPLNAPCKFLDISCGEDKFLFQVRRLLPPGSVVVGNDVAWGALNVLIAHKVRNKAANVYFTNHPAAEAPYQSDFFDIGICKNSLHHMRDYREAIRTIENLIRVTKRKVVVVDFEDPRKTGWLPWTFNTYYRYVLKDQGRNFLTDEEFHRLFEHELKDTLDKKGFVATINSERSAFGKTMWAVLEPKNI
jgi:ubiquinone/menaquinone biosynthesis C-methylase UbiE